MRYWDTARTLTRSRSRSKRPLAQPRPRRDVLSVVTGAPPGSLSVRCVASQFPLFNNISPRLFCPLIIDRFGRTVLKEPIRARLAVGTQGGTSPGTGMQPGGLDTLRNEHEYVPEDQSLELSALRERFDSTPMVLPIRANLDRVKRLLKVDLYIGLEGSGVVSFAVVPFWPTVDLPLSES